MEHWRTEHAAEPMPMAEALLCRSQLTAMLRGIAGHVDGLMLLTGGRGISQSGPLTQVWLDLCAARHHIGNMPDAADLAIAESVIAETVIATAS